jgi:L-seryl-tRNA(Ser) seleniumtransferase
MLTTPPDILASRAAELAQACPAELAPECRADLSAVGGGAFPGAALPTTVVALTPGPLGADGLALRLRLSDPAVIVRIADGRLLLDPRTLPPSSAPAVGAALRAALSQETAP